VLAKAAGPRIARRWWALHRSPVEVDWVRPSVASEVRKAYADDLADEPLRWDRRIAWWSRQRYVLSLCEAHDLLARDLEVAMVHPLLDPRFLSAVARTGPVRGPGGRGSALARIFGDLLPASLFERETKANFTRPYWSGAAQFAAAWQGEGVPPDLADPDTLRSIWSRPAPDARTGLLLQAAWLATSGLEVKEPFNCRL
jgi:asparagine synthase (glutamine-hydrolysing)